MFRPFAVLVLLFVLLILVFSIPKVQTWAAQKTTSYINEKYDVDIQINKLRIGYLAAIEAEGLFIKDNQNDTLVFANKVNTSVVSIPNLIKGNVDLKYLYFKDLKVKMVVRKGADIDNFRELLNRFKPNKKSKTKSVVKIDHISVDNGYYSYTKESSNETPIVVISKIYLNSDNFIVDNGAIATQITKSSLVYKNHIKVSELESQFKMASGKLFFDDLKLITQYKSNVNGQLHFNYNKGDMSDFYNKVILKAKINNSNLATNDLRFFYKEFGVNQFIKIKTSFLGTLNNFKLSNLELKGLGESSITGDLQLKNSMSPTLIQDFIITGDLKNLSTSKNDLERLLPNILKNKLPKQLAKLEKVSFKGIVTATPKNTRFKGAFVSPLGNAKANLFLDDITNTDKLSYKGTILVTRFNLGKYFSNPKLGLVSFNSIVDGQGFSRNKINTFLEGTINEFEYMGYRYKDIYVVGDFQDNVFDGKLTSNDANFNLKFNGKIDINEEVNNLDFKADVSKIDFNELNLFKRDSISNFKGKITAKFKGKTIDDFVGNIIFSNTVYRNQNNTYTFDDFKIGTQFSRTGDRIFSVNSPEIIQGFIRGKFEVKNLNKMIENSFIGLYKQNKYNALLPNYLEEEIKEESYFNFNFKIYNKIIAVFLPQITLAPNTSIKGMISSDVSKFDITFKTPKITFNNSKTSVENLDLIIDADNPLFNSLITLDKYTNKTYPISNFSLYNRVKKDTLYSSAFFKGGKKIEDKYELNTYHSINKQNKSVIGIKKSFAKIKNNIWNMNPKNDSIHTITFNQKRDSIQINTLKMIHEKEEIILGGTLLDSTYKDLKLKFTNVNLEKIAPSIDSLQYKGIVNGAFSLKQEVGQYFPESNLNITDFAINDLNLGDVVMKIIGNEDLTTYLVNAYVGSEEEKQVNIVGTILKEKKIAAKLDLKARLLNFNLKPFSPLGGVVLSNLRGDLNGDVLIKGKLTKPEISGDLYLKNSGVTFPYLNIDFKLIENSKISLIKNQIQFNTIEIVDTKYTTKGYLGGNISHTNFKDWELDLSIKSKRLLALNTNEDDNELYYGTAFINGEATIKGPTTKPVIKVVASSEKGTEFKIPISDTETIGDNSFIHFVTPAEKEIKVDNEKTYFEDVKGLELEFDLDLNQNAEVEVVIDKESGSTLKGNGSGTLLIEINTKGKFNIWGDFVAYKGVYNFKYGGILSKRFDLESGGSINWNGSPTKAILNLSAVYKTNANPSILLDGLGGINRKIPVSVVTMLQGELLKPDLSFDIQFPGTSSVVRSELDYLLADKTTKERQALSLVTQGRFYSDAIIGSNAIITENLVEQASSIVNSIFSDEEDKFKIGLNYVQGERNPDQEIANQFGVSLSTQINDRILINGKVGVPVGGISESVVVGDVRIDFLLNEEGTLRANIFNRENDLQFIGESNGYTQGIGLSYSYDFDTFKELIRKIFTKK